MLFVDKNRIDPDFIPKTKIQNKFKPESLTTLMLDKEDLFNSLPEIGDMESWN